MQGSGVVVGREHSIDIRRAGAPIETPNVCARDQILHCTIASEVSPENLTWPQIRIWHHE